MNSLFEVMGAPTLSPSSFHEHKRFYVAPAVDIIHKRTQQVIFDRLHARIANVRVEGVW